MAVKVGKTHLQANKYKYTWNRDKGDGEYAGKLDGDKVDKDEGYEVLYFIQSFMNKHGLKTLLDVYKIEDALHSTDFKSIVFRDDLIGRIEKRLGL